MEADRASDALDWVRRTGKRKFNRANNELNPEQVALEARILQKLGNKNDAQSLRWRCFEAVLSPDVLRDYLKHLPDFEDFEAEGRAHKFALAHSDRDAAMQFFLAWPRHDLLADLIVAHRLYWDGRDWHILPKIAALLEYEYPLAATILYRTLLDDILNRAR